MKNTPTVFISYSWDNTKHQQWVLSIADLINDRGGKAVVDRTHLKYGGHIKSFMLKSILEADVVLMVLTPKYKKKAADLVGGAGYEYNIITDELFKLINDNSKYIPVIREGSFETSTTKFLQGFNCVDLRDTDQYDENLEGLLIQILNKPELPFVSNTKNKPKMEQEYKPQNEILTELNKKAYGYFEHFFGKGNEITSKLKIQSTIKDWEEQVESYQAEIVEQFNSSKMEIYEDYLEDFKKQFSKHLWTVKAALKTPDPDLARYKRDYRDADAGEVFNTVNTILDATHNYVKKFTPTINYQNNNKIETLKLDYLNEENMFMSRIIGFGIRSEILHRYYPQFFPIMTQKSLWGMYFICDSANEFITIEERKRDGIMRVSHNWQYPYDRFTFLMNEFAKLLVKWFDDRGVVLQSKYRFGYVNLFLAMVQNHHKSDIRLLHDWVDS